jgi:hypothetical protein
MKIFIIIFSVLLLAGLVESREIATEEPVTITGKLSLSNSFVYVTTNDTVSGKGDGVELHNEPVHRFVVSERFTPWLSRARNTIIARLLLNYPIRPLRWIAGSSKEQFDFRIRFSAQVLERGPFSMPG